LFVFYIILQFKVSGQEPSPSQFWNCQTYYNPAFIGEECFRTTLNYRQMWSQIHEGYPFTTKYISSEFPLPFQRILKAVGFNITDNMEGDGSLRTLYISGGLSAHIPISRSFSVDLGVLASNISKQINYSKLIFSDQYDNYGNFNNSSTFKPELFDRNVNFWDFSGGILANHKTSGKLVRMTNYFGVAVYHVKQTGNVDFRRTGMPLPFKFVVHANSIVSLQNCSLEPAIVFEKETRMNTYFIGSDLVSTPMHTNFGNKKRFGTPSFYGGFWFRKNESYYGPTMQFDALSVTFGLRNYAIPNSVIRLTIGYSYDYTLSKLQLLSGGSHEIALQVMMCSKKSASKSGSGKKPIECPAFD